MLRSFDPGSMSIKIMVFFCI